MLAIIAVVISSIMRWISFLYIFGIFSEQLNVSKIQAFEKEHKGLVMLVLK